MYDLVWKRYQISVQLKHQNSQMLWTDNSIITFKPES